MSFLLRQLCATLVIVVLIRCSQSYFAFPRQGRAMSFYFPRMGRSGDNNMDESNFCCEEGVRRIVTTGKGAFEICPRDQDCCAGMDERTKLYKDIIITECAVDSNLDKIRAYIGED